jgi:hypothetical protein
MSGIRLKGGVHVVNTSVQESRREIALKLKVIQTASTSIHSFILYIPLSFFDLFPLLFSFNDHQTIVSIIYMKFVASADAFLLLKTPCPTLSQWSVLHTIYLTAP